MNILIADDHALFRDTLQHYINRSQPQYQVDMAASLPEALKFLHTDNYRPDLVILDFKMPGMRGASSFENLIRKFPDYKIAVMSGVADTNDIEKVIDLGVSGYLPKTLPGRLMLDAIETMLAGQKFIPRDAKTDTIMPSTLSDIGAYKTSAETGETVDHNVKFTGREKDVLRLLCQGLANKDIADQLGLQVVTVKLHIRGIFKKLDCENRTQAVLKAGQMGFI